MLTWVGKRDSDDSPGRMYYDADAPAPVKRVSEQHLDGAATEGGARGFRIVASPLGVLVAAGVWAGSVAVDWTAVMTG